ncbi:MFS transporter [Streptomyces sp. VRA16 Mangrove soil]|uniref:MFS transporter n=1 Tax=Streptomyces sp. VRA16 Mangrove soil TaxID=2817434 RepID=UPI001A9F8290|nr:MFS transporter [Streptomyces sp. VRA16 Mangrove soil]MBO1334170.1 MFS transporter [Streptomyces sp. VRA16 Mangrove soil]
MRPQPLWRNRQFTALWGGQVVSALGSTGSQTAMPLLVLASGGSAADAGFVAAAGSLPHLVAQLPAGSLVDRWNRRRVLILSEAAAGLALATVPFAIWAGVVTVWHLAVVAFAQGLGFVFFGLAEHAALPHIVPASQLPTAVARNEARNRGAALAGRPLGGALFGIASAVPFLVDVVSYAIASAGLLLLRGELKGATDKEPAPLWRATTEGLRWVWRHPLIRAAVLLVAASNLVFQAVGLVIVVRAQQHGASSAAIGTMLGVYSTGGLLGAFAAARLHRHFTPKSVIIGVNWVWAGLLPLFLLTTDPLVTGLIGAATSFVGPLWNVVIGSYMALLVPDELRARVSSAGMTLSWGVMPVAALGAGWLLTSVGPQRTLAVLAAITFATAVAAAVSPAVRRAPTLTTDAYEA